MRGVWLWLLLSAVGCAPSQPAETTAPEKQDEGEGGLFYGPGYSFMLMAPAGWVLDSETGAPHGLSAILYRTGTSPETLPALYVRPVMREGDQTLDSLLAHAPSAERQAVWKTRDGKRVDVRKLSGPPELRVAAYIEERPLFVELGLVADDDSYDGGLAALRALAGSYKWVSGNVTIEPDAAARNRR